MSGSPAHRPTPVGKDAGGEALSNSPNPAGWGVRVGPHLIQPSEPSEVLPQRSSQHPPHRLTLGQPARRLRRIWKDAREWGWVRRVGPALFSANWIARPGSRPAYPAIVAILATVRWLLTGASLIPVRKTATARTWDRCLRRLHPKPAHALVAEFRY